MKKSYEMKNLSPS